MRRLLAAFLLICLGLMLPTAASPWRFCLTAHTLLVPGISNCEEATTPDSCCKECGETKKKDDSCCLKTEKLPDSTAPAPSAALPPVLMTDIPEFALFSPILCEAQPVELSFSEPIRGPTSPAAHRAVLGIWRL